jgi:hypothetical protein
MGPSSECQPAEKRRSGDHAGKTRSKFSVAVELGKRGLV